MSTERQRRASVRLGCRDARRAAARAGGNLVDRNPHFAVYPVQEWCGSSTAGGDHNVVFLGDERPGFPYNARGEHNRTLVWNEDMKGNAVELGRWQVEELWDAHGDADSIEIDVSNLAAAHIVIEGTIDGFVKVGDPLAGNPVAHTPTFRRECSGAELLARGSTTRALGGTGLFVAVERLTEKPLPVDLSGSIELASGYPQFGFRPVYFFGRQRDDSKAWSSVQFITFR